MNVRLFQINSERDENRICFTPYDKLADKDIDSSLYDITYAGEIPSATNLEEVWEIFNTPQRPSDFMGRSLSVSDVLEVRHELGSDYYYCDSVGFKEIEFEPSEAEIKYKERMDVVFLEPGKKARVGKLDADLSAMQRYVEGWIEAVYPFEAPVAIVCNEEGKINGMPLNRALKTEDGDIYDIIAGKAFVCSCRGSNFSSLTQEECKEYAKIFEKPEMFIRTSEGIKSIPMDEIGSPKHKR